MTEGTECWLTEKLGHKLMTLDLMDFLVLDGPPAPGDVRPRVPQLLLFETA
jgi:hypothetical protein